MIRQQFIYYAAIGLGLNATLYAAYLLLTWRWMGSEAAMTITFSTGVLLAFFANRNLTFRHSGSHLPALLRYLTCYAILYVIDFAALWFFSEQLGFAHQIVQGCVILVLPPLAFVMQKYWVFTAAAASHTPSVAKAEP